VYTLTKVCTQSENKFFVICRFSWQKSGEKLDVSGNDNRFTQQPNKGTIVINDPLKKDEGVYQCFARNDFGIAVTQKAILKVAGKWS
jgi:hypothetical protein